MTREEAIDILFELFTDSDEVDDAIDVAMDSMRILGKLTPSLEGMAEDMRAMGDDEKASGVESALWLIKMMERGER